MESTGTLTLAVDLLLGRADENELPPHISNALRACAVGKAEFPSRSRLCDWYKNRREGGIDALVPQHKGRARTEGGWEATAVALYNQPSQPSYASVHKALTEIHGFTCQYPAVKAYLKALPAQLGKHGPARLGTNLHRLTQKGFVRRSTENLRVGDIYVADGYKADVYLAHPMTGDIFRPELTVSMDLKSRFIVGWRLDEHEGSFAVQSMWAETFTRHNHVPPLLYIDNGSGYRNSFVDEEITGFYARAGVVQIIHSIPGNPHGKGWIERFFNTMKEDFLKMWRPEFYCGDDMADEMRNKIVRECKARRLTPPSVLQFTDAFNEWLSRYHERKHPEETTISHAGVWRGLVAIPPAMSLIELKRFIVQLKVRRASVKHKKREYKHADLYAFNGQTVQVELDMMDNRIAVIRTLSGVWLCDATLITPIDVVPVTMLEEKRITRASDAIKRLNKKIQEHEQRSGHLIDADAIADGALAIDSTATRLENDDEDEIKLELY
ncbi:MAG: Mu transposase C-terminal domain-containing protein [Methylovulum miyakonense]|uniref:Mu transposase C-terminal domain-containing protein n=1 Tax=Methylovulum miyakonense TaxID=645578 RepID=UPI003BB7CD8B